MHAAVWANISLSPSRRHTPLFRLTRTLGVFAERTSIHSIPRIVEVALNPLKLREDEIGRKLDEAQKSGELQSAASYGKPMSADTCWEATPDEFRLGFKILKDAGVVPPEVELFHERARLRASLESASTETERIAVQRALSELEQKLSIRLSAMRASAAL